MFSPTIWRGNGSPPLSYGFIHNNWILCVLENKTQIHRHIHNTHRHYTSSWQLPYILTFSKQKWIFGELVGRISFNKVAVCVCVCLCVRITKKRNLKNAPYLNHVFADVFRVNYSIFLFFFRTLKDSVHQDPKYCV